MTVYLTTQEVLDRTEGAVCATVCTRRNEGVPSRGYYVAIPDYGGIDIPVSKFYESRKAALAQTNKFLGIWTHAGHTHLDVVDCFYELAPALRAGKERGEYAIWDIANQKEIVL